jgi:hypothetical protein
MTKTVYVIDQDGATFVTRTRRHAQRVLVHEAWGGAVHLTITKAHAPVTLRGQALVDWCIAHVPPITCQVQ